MFMTKERQASPFKVGLPHYVEFHGDIPLRFSKTVEGVTAETPKVKPHPLEGAGKGSLKHQQPYPR
jgi:hypothetical protein